MADIKTQFSDTPSFNEGDIVCDKLWPERQLRVRRFVDRIYYCRDLSGSVATDLVYFERELQRC